jgi:hypothetical protein
MSVDTQLGLEPSPIEIDPRPCEWCGLTIDQHVMVDDGDGPEFFCEEANPYAANLVLQWEMQDPRDAWRHTGEIPVARCFQKRRLPRLAGAHPPKAPHAAVNG